MRSTLQSFGGVRTPEKGKAGKAGSFPDKVRRVAKAVVSLVGCWDIHPTFRMFSDWGSYESYEV